MHSYNICSTPTTIQIIFAALFCNICNFLIRSIVPPDHSTGYSMDFGVKDLAWHLTIEIPFPILAVMLVIYALSRNIYC